MAGSGSSGVAGRFARAVGEPWALLTSGVAGGAAWAVGLAVPVAGAVAAGTLATAAVVSMLRRESDDGSEEPQARLAGGTEQASCIAALDGYVAKIQTLTHRGLAPELVSTAADALRVAEESRDRAYRVALAIDLLDSGINQSASVRGFTAQGSRTIQDSVARMAARRQSMIGKLHSAIDQVASMYAQLIEVSTTASTLDVSVEGGGSVGAINDSLTALQQTFTELEDDAASVRGDAPRSTQPKRNQA